MRPDIKAIKEYESVYKRDRTSNGNISWGNCNGGKQEEKLTKKDRPRFDNN